MQDFLAESLKSIGLEPTEQIIDELNKYYSDKLFKTKISRCVSLSEAPSYGEPIYYYSRYSKGSMEYEDVAKEIIKRTDII